MFIIRDPLPIVAEMLDTKNPYARGLGSVLSHFIQTITFVSLGYSRETSLQLLRVFREDTVVIFAFNDVHCIFYLFALALPFVLAHLLLRIEEFFVGLAIAAPQAVPKSRVLAVVVVEVAGTRLETWPRSRSYRKCQKQLTDDAWCDKLHH